MFAVSSSVVVVTFMCFIQFLGRDKDDGVRLSAISGKKVRQLLHFIRTSKICV